MNDDLPAHAATVGRPGDNLSFEQAFGELEATVSSLERGELTLQETIALYERGMHLARRCNDALDAAELQVQQLAVADGQQQMAMLFDQETDQVLTGD